MLSYIFGQGYLIGYLAAWEGPQLLLAKVNDASGRIGIFFQCICPDEWLIVIHIVMTQ